MTFTDMHVVITGGAGFIGGHSVEALLEKGARVTVFDNFSNGSREKLPESGPLLSIIEGDVRSSADVARALQGATHVLHLAAQVSVQASIADPVVSCGHNVAGFVNVLDAARRVGVRRLVYASSAAVYGAPRALPLTEESATGPISPYGLEKWIDERYADLYSRLYDFPSLGLRYFNVYGPRQDATSPYAGVISKFAAAIRCGSALHVFGDGQQKRDFVFVKDVARINLLALAADFKGICNIGTGRSVTLLDLIATLEQVSGKQASRQFEPPNRGDIPDSSMSPERMLAWFQERPSTPLADGLSLMLRS
jgi:UDP-glucose 4-epimerase